MDTITHIINDSEKLILENYFIHRKNNSKKDYLHWIEKFFIEKKIQPTDIKKSVYSTEYQIDMIWDKEKNISLAQHLAQHPNYQHSNSLLKNINKFHSNWSHIDNQGNNILHYAAQHNYKFLNDLRATKEIDRTLINNKGQSYHCVYVENLDFKKLTDDKEHGNLNLVLSKKFTLIENIIANLCEFTKMNLSDSIDSYSLTKFINKGKVFSNLVELFIDKNKNLFPPKFYQESYQNIQKFIFISKRNES